jgi:hypothetical protein
MVLGGKGCGGDGAGFCCRRARLEDAALCRQMQACMGVLCKDQASGVLNIDQPHINLSGTLGWKLATGWLARLTLAVR